MQFGCHLSCCDHPVLGWQRRFFAMEINLYQLFGVGALAHRGLLPDRVFVREVPLAFPAPHILPVRAVQVIAAPCFTRQISSRLVPFMPKQIWFSALRKLLWFREQGSHPSEAVHMFKVICSCLFPPFGFTLAYHTLGCKCVYSF